MGLKSAWREVADYAGIRSGGDVVVISAMAAFWGAMGIVGSTFSTNFRGDDAVGGVKAGEAQVAEYRKEFRALAEEEKTILQLRQVAESAKIDARMDGDASSAAKRKFDRATVLAKEDSVKMKSHINQLSQKIVLDQNVPEIEYDGLIKHFREVVNIYSLPSYVFQNGEPTAWDSTLRECQVAHKKVEDVVDCTGDSVFSDVVSPGFGAGAGLFLTWIMALGPYLQYRRRREDEKPKPVDDTVTTNLKITYKFPRNG